MRSKREDFVKRLFTALVVVMFMLMVGHVWAGKPTPNDSDGDGVLDHSDMFPFDPSKWMDTDGDGKHDGDDDDIDGDNTDAKDGKVNIKKEKEDKFPRDSKRKTMGDINGDGKTTDDEINLAKKSDSDGDGKTDFVDDDIDGDGVLNIYDAFPFDPYKKAKKNDAALPIAPNEWKDSDRDGVGDNRDNDDDNDGIPDENDAYPTFPNDTDSDGDRIRDIDDAFPNDRTQWSDRDGDGYGDNPHGNKPDRFPDDPERCAYRDNRDGKHFNFGFGLKGGWSSWALGDLGLSKEYFENLSEIPGYSATTNDLSGSPFGEADLILEYNLPNHHKLGLSVGFQYFPGGTFEQSWSYQDTASTSKLVLSAYSIPVELFYKPRFAKNLFLKIGGGVTFYNAAIDYDSSFSMSGQEYSYMGKLKDSGIGGHVSLGAEYALTKNLSLSIDAGYAFAKLNNLTATLVDRDGTGTEMLLTMARDEFGEMLSIYPTTEPLPAHSRPAEIDLSGFKFSLGFKIFLKK